MKTFKQISNLDPKSVLLVDSLNLAFRWKHKGATDFQDEYINTVESLRKSYKTEKVIITCDGGSSSFRRGIFPDYKQNRKARFEDQTDAERLYFEQFLKEFSRIIDYYKEESGYPTLRFSGVEADDLAAYITRKVKKNYNVWLVSSDKDWDLLVDNNVSRFSYVTRKEVTIDNWNTHYEFDPDDYISIKCLTGDLGDGIPGVDGIGPKRAISLVQEFGSAYDIAANLPISSKYKYVAALNAFGTDNIIRNYMLMDIVTHCEDAIGDENIREIDRILGGYLETV